MANGTFRQYVLVPNLGMAVALPLSGLTLSLLVLVMTYLCTGFLGVESRSACFLVGAQWVLMTLAFEFLFGHFAVGKPWSELLQTFNILKGDLFSLVLLVTFFAPYLMAKAKGVI